MRHPLTFISHRLRGTAGAAGLSLAIALLGPSVLRAPRTAAHAVEQAPQALAPAGKPARLLFYSPISRPERTFVSQVDGKDLTLVALKSADAAEAKRYRVVETP